MSLVSLVTSVMLSTISALATPTKVQGWGRCPYITDEGNEAYKQAVSCAVDTATENAHSLCKTQANRISAWKMDDNLKYRSGSVTASADFECF